MQSENQESFLTKTQKSILVLFLIVIIFFLFFFKNLFFQPTIILKNFGSVSIVPEIAFENNKPTFLEFYAEWCEVCKEMAPRVDSMRKEYEKDINFVFLNVDNPLWEKYIKKFNVNGIPQVNIFDNQGNLRDTFIGKQDEKDIEKALVNLNNYYDSNSRIINQNISLIEKNKSNQASPRSHS